MADIRRFTGYIAPDGSTHESLKKAQEHTKNLKVMDALNEAFLQINPHTHGNHVVDNRDSGAIVPAELMPMFLLDNRDKIEACFNQEVLMRAKRKPKAKAATPASIAGLVNGQGDQLSRLAH